jgi:hypothetical protein
LRATLALASLAAPVRILPAQANLSGQGLGYPTGQLSARAAGTGGAIGEIDPLSQLNPAALGFAGTTTLFFQIEPEFRRVNAGSLSDKTTTARYPLFAAAIPLGSSWAVGISSATLLDRTWTTSTRTTVVAGSDTVASTFIYGSDGSINDLRLAAQWMPATWARLGLGGHLISGSDRVFIGRTFENSAFGSFADTSILSFDGGAVSAGVQIIAPKVAILSAAYRKGGQLNARRSDTALGSARVPDRLGFSVAYIGIAGTQIAARTSYDKWAALNGLRRGAAEAVNAWDTSLGADISGPHFGAAAPLMLRVGGRWRTLPYEAAGKPVRERSVSAGLGALFAGGRVLTDLTLIRAARDADITSGGSAINERAWTLSIGLGVRP